MGSQRLVALFLAFALALPGCAHEPSLAEYGHELEVAVASMNARLDALDEEMSGPVDLETVRRYATERVAARREFLATLRDLDPPEGARELQNSAIVIIGRLTDAESSLADYVMGLDAVISLDDIWRSPLGVAARTADDAAIALCEAAEAEFDRTKDRTDLGDVPWIPPELKEVVTVAFGCHGEDR